MQQGIVTREVYEPTLTATIGGQVVDVESASVTRALPDPLGRGRMRAAEVKLGVLEGDVVTDRVATPWDPGTDWPPEPETPASVSMDAGAGPVSLLTGRVTHAAGESSDRVVQVDLGDAYQTLDRTISWDNLADAMPSEQEATDQRYVSLRATAVTDMILRHCGWYCTPPRLGFPVLSVPAMGTMWPERGTCVTSVGAGGTGYPLMFTEPWGVGVGDVTATYRRAAEYTIKARGRVEMTAIAGRLNGGVKNLAARTSTFRWVRLSWTDTTASLWVTDAAGNYALAASRPRALGSFLYATVEYVSDTSVRVILRVDGQSTTVTVPVHADLTTLPLTDMTIDGSGVGAGFQVAFPSFTGELAAWKPNAVIYDRAASFNHLLVLKAIENASCADLLQQQCEAQAATFWIDETGVLRWWDLSRLEAQSVDATVTSLDHLDDGGFSWSHDRSAVKSRVKVTWREPLAMGGWRTATDFWQGSGQTLNTTGVDNPYSDWIRVPDEEVWIMPDLSLTRVWEAAGDDFNYGFGSWYGGVIPGAGSTADRWPNNDGSLLMTIEKVTDNAFKYAITWTGTPQVVMRTPDPASASELWRVRRDFDLPILRGKKKYTLNDRTTLSPQVGPSTAPEHVIDAGWWIQTQAQADYLASYAGARLTVPQPVLSGIVLAAPIPGLQIGDMVEAVDSHRTRLTIRGLVEDISLDIDSGMGGSQVIAVRPVLVSRNGITWHEWARVARPKTLAQWATNQNSTWTVWGTDPLGKET